MVKTTAIAFLSLLAMAACSDEGGTVLPPDAGFVPMADAAPTRVCTLIESSYPDLGAVTGTATFTLDDVTDPTSEQYLELQIPLNTDAEPDILFFEVWFTQPPFDEGAAPYTISILGDQTDVIDCSACTFVAADFTDRNSVNFNFAYTGEIVLTALDLTPDTGKVTGSLSNVLLHEISFSADGQETVPDGCLSSIEAVTFDFDVGPALVP
jgi:hypothetical protein